MLRHSSLPRRAIIYKYKRNPLPNPKGLKRDHRNHAIMSPSMDVVQNYIMTTLGGKERDEEKIKKGMEDLLRALRFTFVKHHNKKQYSFHAPPDR